jgi:hypothetical protein
MEKNSPLALPAVEKFWKEKALARKIINILAATAARVNV